MPLTYTQDVSPTQAHVHPLAKWQTCIWPFCLTQYEATWGAAIPTHQNLSCMHCATFRMIQKTSVETAMQYTGIQSHSKVLSKTSHYMPAPTFLHHTVACKRALLLHACVQRPCAHRQPAPRRSDQAAGVHQRQPAPGMHGSTLQQAWQPQQPLVAPAGSSADRFMRCCFDCSASLRHAASGNIPAPTHVSNALLHTMR